MAVRIEIGISFGDSDRAAVSTSIMNDAPMLTDAGSKISLLSPKRIRQMCGTKSPTQPTCPHMDTQEAVIIVAHTLAENRSFAKSTPEVIASSGDSGNRFIRQRSSNRITVPKRIGGIPQRSDRYPALSMLPISQ